MIDDLVIGDDIPESPEWRDTLGLLEYFLSAALAEVYEDWRRDESLDGILPWIARKVAERTIDVRGDAYLISGPLVPIHVKLEVMADRDRLHRLECRVCEAEPKQRPYGPQSTASAIQWVDWKLGRIESLAAGAWRYRIGGEFN
ncbi:MAG: hypothetical protein H6820_16705 [Phycisphaerales bacterium]|nr:hypothetical protein [Phycisphaerales bacterium]